MSKTLQERVVNLIPSKSLKKAIRETEFQLSDIALLSTAYEYAPNFDSRLEYLMLIRDILSGEIRAYADRIIESEHQMKRAFFQYDPTAVLSFTSKKRRTHMTKLIYAPLLNQP